MDTLNGLSLFTGIGGIDLALSEWVKPTAYCENDRYAQSVLISRMVDGLLPVAPIWDDVRTLKGSMFNIGIDIIYGGFPCQDISVAGAGKGLEGERSCLFFEIIRLTDELKPSFVFLENVPAIRTRGLDRVLQEFTQRGYDCRWTMLQAAEVGAIHRRERWFLLAYSKCIRLTERSRESLRSQEQKTERQNIYNILQKSSNTNINSKRCDDGINHRSKRQVQANKEWKVEKIQQERNKRFSEFTKDIHVTNYDSKRIQGFRSKKIYKIERFSWCQNVRGIEDLRNRSDIPEPIICRKGNGIPNSVEQIKCLGNAVVPLQAKTAFQRLIGI